MNDLTQLLIRDLQLEETESPKDEAAILQWLANQVAYMLEYKLDFLMSLMYRLDIPESEVGAAISPTNFEPTNLAIAKLIIERQKERLFTKEYYTQTEIEGIDEHLKW